MRKKENVLNAATRYALYMLVDSRFHSLFSEYNVNLLLAIKGYLLLVEEN
jgi:hypothetical protein